MSKKDNIISVYKQRLNLQDAIFHRIDHEDAMVAIVYKITQPNGTQLVLKYANGLMITFEKYIF